MAIRCLTSRTFSLKLLAAALWMVVPECAPAAESAKSTAASKKGKTTAKRIVKPAQKKSSASTAAPAPKAGTVKPTRVADVPETDPLPRAALVAVFAGDRQQLAHAFWQAHQREQATRDTHTLRTSDAIQYLYNQTLSDREEFLAAQEVAAANARDKDLRTRILMSLLTDEIYELNTVEGQNRFNKFTRVFNRASSSLSQLVMLQPQAAVQLVWDGIYSIRKARPTTDRERKMIFLARNFLKKHPNAPESEEVRQLHEKLKGKLIADEANRGKIAGKLALTRGKFESAEFHLEKAAVLAPADEETSTLLHQARRLRIRQEDELVLGMMVVEQEMPASVERGLQEACEALLTGDRQKLLAVRSQVRELWDSSDYAVAALTEAAGQHNQALQQLHALVQTNAAGPGTRAAARLLANVDYNLDANFEQHLKTFADQQRKFVLTGNRSGEDAAYALGNATIQSAGQAATGVPLLVGLDAAVRAVTEKFRTQVDVTDVVDAGARYLRKYPSSSRSRIIASQLAELSRKAGDYDRTEDYLAEAGVANPEAMAKLRDKKAAALYEQAKAASDLFEKRKLLQELISKYGEAPVVQKSATKELSRIPPGLARDSIVLMLKMLKKDPNIPRTLGLAPTWIDGKKSNGELAEEGLCIHPSAGTFEYKIAGEETYRVAGLPRGNLDSLLAAAQLLQSAYMNTTEAEAITRRQKLPFAIDGSVGGSGVDMAPKIVPVPDNPHDKDRFR